MTFALILICTFVACLVLRRPIKKYPGLFYGISVAVCVIYFARNAIAMPRSVWLVFLPLIHKSMLPLALFVVVMYIGVLSKSSKLYQWLKPVRAELSIIACILSLGHMVVYIQSYLPRILSGGSFNMHVLGSFGFAAVLFVLLLILGITSFQAIKTRMKADSWKRVQKLAYLFFFLVYVHVMLMLLPSALNGGIASTISVGVYSTVFLAYFILRVLRAARDRQAHI